MTSCFVNSFSNLNILFIIFYALSLLQAWRAWRLLTVIRKEWSTFQVEPLTRRKGRIAEEAAFYLAIPPAVFIHELFHAIPIWLFGGQIVECGYGFYWGFVTPDRRFPVIEEWIISIAGTLGSLLFGFILWALLRNHRSSSFRFFALRALRYQIYFSLIFYPLFTAFTFIGDWRIIYNFSLTPLLSGLTAVAHVGTLVWFWRAQENGRFEMPFHETVEEQSTFEQMTREANNNLQDSQRSLEHIASLLNKGATKQAQQQIRHFLAQYPNSGPGHFLLAISLTAEKSRIPRAAVKAAEQAITLGLSEPAHLAQAYQLLGQHAFEREDMNTAVTYFSQALDLINTTSNPLHGAGLYYQRALAYRRRREYDLAYRDAQQALNLAQQGNGNEQLIAYYQEEITIIETHAGRRLSP